MNPGPRGPQPPSCFEETFGGCDNAEDVVVAILTSLNLVALPGIGLASPRAFTLLEMGAGGGDEARHNLSSQRQQVKFKDK